MITVCVIVGAVVACVKAIVATRLLEKNPEAWEKLQEAEDFKRRQRQAAMGNAAVGGFRFLCWVFRRKG